MRRRGFTMIELAIVMGILLIVATIGWSSTRAQAPRMRTVRAAKSLQGDLVELRELAVRSNREARLRLVSSPGDCSSQDYGGAWALELGNRASRSTSWEPVGDGAVDLGPDGNRKARSVCLRRWGGISGPATGNHDALVFSPRGWLANPATDFDSSGYMSLTLVNLDGVDRGVVDEIDVMVSRAGLVRLRSSLGNDGPDNRVGTGTGT